ELTEHVDIAGHRRRLSQADRNEHASLDVHLADLTEVVHALEEPQPRWMRGRHTAQLLFDLEPHRHRVNPHALSGQAGDEELTAIGALERHTKVARNLESSLVIDSGRRIASKHTKFRHRTPLFSRKIHADSR